MPPWYELVELLCIALVIALPMLRLWPAFDQSSPPGRALGLMWQRPYAPHALVIAMGVSVFFIAAEDILDGAPDEVLPWIDHVVHELNRGVASFPAVRHAAAIISDLTGAGLVAAVVTGTVCLVFVRRRRDAVALPTGTAAAWLVSGLLKLGFGVARPRSSLGYGFPSGHALVTVVGCGLLLWTLAHLQGASPRFSRCCTGAIAIGLIAGAARIVLDAHWVSDVIAGVAIGSVWLSLVVLGLSRYSKSRLMYAIHLPVSATRGSSADGTSI
jgi:membrane-associated phospholipid phosphatase